MSDHVYKHTEITGSSATSIEDAVRNGVERAGKEIPNMRWFEVTGTRGYIEDQKVSYWQVSLKIGSRLDD